MDRELIEQAKSVIKEKKIASLSFIQRCLRLNYSNAQKLLEELEKEGCIGPYNKGAPREIYL